MTGDGLEQLASLAHHGARATTFLDHPACWRRAARFSYAEALPAWRKRTHLPHVPAAVDEASLQALAAGLSTYFRPYRGPGHALRRGTGPPGHAGLFLRLPRGLRAAQCRMGGRPVRAALAT
jgi:hypothetical protein